MMNRVVNTGKSETQNPLEGEDVQSQRITAVVLAYVGDSRKRTFFLFVLFCLLPGTQLGASWGQNWHKAFLSSIKIWFT